MHISLETVAALNFKQPAHSLSPAVGRTSSRTDSSDMLFMFR